MIVLGVDLSYRSSGLVLLSDDSPKPLDRRTVITSGEWSRSVLIIYLSLKEFLDRADLVVYEAQVANRKHVRSTSQLAKAHGAFGVALAQSHKPYVEVAPVRLRSWALIPKGKKLIDMNPSLRLEGWTSDEADALGLAMMGLQFLNKLNMTPPQKRIIIRLEVIGG